MCVCVCVCIYIYILCICMCMIYIYIMYYVLYILQLTVCLYILFMPRTCFRVNPHSVIACMSRNSLLETGAKLATLASWLNS